MRDPFDAWYVRLPDGRVVRAKTTASVRHHVETGQIPVDSWVRRRGDEAWSSLEWTTEFADLVTAKRKEASRPIESSGLEKVAASNGPPRIRHELHTVGVSGLVEELLTALDSTLNQRKLVMASFTCLAVSATLIASRLVGFWQWETPWCWVGWFVTGTLPILILAVGTALLTQITVIELSQFRQPRSQEIYPRLVVFSSRIAGCLIIIGGGVLVTLAGLRLLPGWVASNEAVEPLPALAVVAALVLEVLLWPVIGLCLLLGPVAVIEDASLLGTIGLWWSLVRRNLARVLLYQGLALTIAVIMSVPFLLPVWLAASQRLDGQPALITLTLLMGVALTPLYAYLVVANVFIYLNLRYEFSVSERE
ncbi:MAG: hypothetical protein FJ271_04175 [Planctomycetes bacterium]|nr:hypothetical protein [Planctomycetota bacterium]